MPPKAKFAREEIVRAALEIVRKKGPQGLTARALGMELGSSTRPIFTVFQSMEEVEQEAFKAADALYESRLKEEMSKGEYPPYKASGMGYIRFAREEGELFKWLFMRDRSQEKIETQEKQLKPILDLLQKDMGLETERAYRFHMEMWIFVHGIATMIVTGYLNWDMKIVSGVLTDAYCGLRSRYLEEGKRDAGNSDGEADKEIR